MRKKYALLGFILSSITLVCQYIAYCLESRHTGFLNTFIFDLSYFTTISNILVLVCYSLDVFDSKWKHKYAFRLLTVCNITITSICFYAYGMDKWHYPYAFNVIVSHFLHAIIPITFVVYNIFVCRDAKKFNFNLYTFTSVFYFGYTLYAQVVARIINEYPYPFFDLSKELPTFIQNVTLSWILLELCVFVYTKIEKRKLNS